MASITSNGTGPWATGGTWVGGVSPGNGDTAIIANGHTVTIASSTSVTVGDSANPTTPAISSNNSNGTGILIVGSSATLTVKGNVRQGNANWTINASATINFLHATANLSWQITDDGGTTTNAKLIFAGGTGASRITCAATGAAAGGGFGNVTASKFVRGGQLEATGVQFTSIGTASIVFLDYRPASASYSGFFDDCLFTSCGKISASHAPTAGAVIRLRRTTFRSPVDTDGRVFEMAAAIPASQTGIVFDRVRWEGQIYLTGASGSGLTWSDMCGQSYGSLWPLECTATPPNVTADLTLLHNRIAASALPSRLFNGTITRLMSNREGQGVEGNGHAMTMNLSSDTTIVGGIFEMGVQDEQGDQFQVTTNPAAAKALGISGVIAPPQNGLAPGSFVNVSIAGTGANLRLTVEQNTVVCSADGGAPGGLFQTEQCTGGAGMVPALRDNLCWRPASGAGWVSHTQSSTLANGSVVGADYNARVNLTTDGYDQADAIFSTPSPPGTHDFTTSPAFVDSTRNLLTWGQSVSGSISTRQDVIDALLKRNDDAGWNSGFTLDAYYTWVRAGFAPTVAAFNTSGHAGGQVGALAAVVTLPQMRPLGSRQAVTRAAYF